MKDYYYSVTSIDINQTTLLCKQLPIDQVQQNIFPFDKTNRIEKVSLCMIVIIFNLIDILFNTLNLMHESCAKITRISGGLAL
jgi:hypothetical protein